MGVARRIGCLFTVSSAAVVVAANEFARQNLLRIGIAAEQIRKITPGVDCRRFRPETPPSHLVEQHRLQGKKVIYQPASRLIHYEGITTGTDVRSGLKQLQVTRLF